MRGKKIDVYISATEFPSGEWAIETATATHLHLSVEALRLVKHFLRLLQTLAELRRVLSRRQLAVVRLQDGAHAVAFLQHTHAQTLTEWEISFQISSRIEVFFFLSDT